MHNKSLPRNMPLQWVSNGAGLTPARPLVSKSSLLTDASDAGHVLVHELLQFYSLEQEAQGKTDQGKRYMLLELLSAELPEQA
jgi:hypothetical protein